MSYLDHKDDNYLFPLDYYGYPVREDGFSPFRFEGDGLWYFAYYEKGHLLMRSEGYESEAARDHGIEAVKKYMHDAENYHVIQLPNGRWVHDLKAPNHKEIARTAQFLTKEEAEAHLPGKRDLADAPAPAGARAKDDDYLACRKYEDKPRSTQHPEFTVFDENGEHYCALADDDGEILLRSEGYESEAARKHGMESILRYKGHRELYKTEEHLGYYFVYLYAPNHHEIARSCPKSEAEAAALIDLLVGDVKTTQERAHDDDYLACKEYEGRPRDPEHSEFTVFDERGEHFFALVDDDGEVLLRSEGYESEAARKNGMESVLKNKGNRENYKVEEHLGYHFVILKAPNHKEIARSCPKSEMDALALINLLLGVAPVHERAHDDDYLACKEYADRPRDPEHPEFTVFDERGEHYFALVDENGEVLMRGEGYESVAARKHGMESVLKYKGDKDNYTIEEHLGYHFVILKAPNHKEIARSCPKSEAEALALIALLTGLAPKAEPAVAMAAPPPAAKKSGFNWWWILLPLLLLLLLFLLMRSCNKTEETPAAAAPAAETGTASIVYASEADCGWLPVLFDIDKYVVKPEGRTEIRKVVDVLNSNPKYRALFIGFTDSTGSQEHNIVLSQNRADAVKQVAVEMGAAANRISTLEEDEHNPAATNKNELGRHFNRRVVMYVLNESNHLVCKQVLNEIPEELQPEGE